MTDDPQAVAIEVLAAHTETGDWPIICTCGLAATRSITEMGVSDQHRAHLAAELAERGLLVRELGEGPGDTMARHYYRAYQQSRAVELVGENLVLELAEVSKERDELREGLAFARAALAEIEAFKEQYHEQWMLTQQELTALREGIQAVLPDECWVFRSPDKWRCTNLVNGAIGAGPGVWTEEMCCLPCRIRALVDEG